MSINFNSAEVQIREDRLRSISGFQGTVSELSGAAASCGLKGQRKCFSENSSCMAGCAQGYLSTILDAAIVNHAPVGCASDAMGANNARKWGEYFQGIPHTDVAIYSTNMTEQDTIFGAPEKLRDTIRSAYAQRQPKAIFVTSSCTSAIIGEDIESVAGELAEELQIPVIYVSCEGFKSKIWASGFDAAFHAILTGITKPPQRKTNVVNVVNFRASSKKSLTDFFRRFGVEPLFITGYCTVEQLSRLSESAATVSICGTLGTYMGNGLEQLYNVPYVKAMQPHGIAGFEAWLREFGRVLHKEGEVEAYIEESRTEALKKLAAIRAQLEGTRAVVGMGPSFALNFTRVLQELGMEVLHTAAWHFDPRYDHNSVPESLAYLQEHSPGLPVNVCDHQYVEVANLLSKLKPDIYFYRHPSNASITMKLGIPAFAILDEYTAFGYDGLISFGHAITDILANRNFERKFASHTRLPYSRWWLSQNAFNLAKEV